LSTKQPRREWARKSSKLQLDMERYRLKEPEMRWGYNDLV